MMEQTRYNILMAVIFLFPQLIILIACIFYLAKKATIDGVLLLIGTLAVVMVIVFNNLILPGILQQHHHNFEDQSLFYVTGAISFLSALIFAIGFLLLILKKVKNPL